MTKHLFQIYNTVREDGRDITVAPFMLRSAPLKKNEKNRGGLFRAEKSCVEVVAACPIAKGQLLKIFSTLHFERSEKRSNLETNLDHLSLVQVEAQWLEEEPACIDFVAVQDHFEEDEREEEEEEEREGEEEEGKGRRRRGRRRRGRRKRGRRRRGRRRRGRRRGRMRRARRRIKTK